VQMEHDLDDDRMPSLLDFDATSVDDTAPLWRPDTSAPPPELSQEQLAWGKDSYLMYLYGLVLKQLGQRKEALEVLCWAVHLSPLNWGAWQELQELVLRRATLEQLDLPSTWLRRMFLCGVFAELNLDSDCLELCDAFEREGLKGSLYLRTQRTLALRNLRELDKCIEEFVGIERLDPFRLENTDIYSNVLFVKEKRVELAMLASRVTHVGKYTVEACCVVGNYHSMRGEHEKAVTYFQRALKLNPKFGSAFTLMGYEYMEMKSTLQAIQCYRDALRINRRDYRAWFGLGQTYEVLRLLNYSLFYFKQAQRLHPYDSRMMTALGEAFERKEMFLQAKKSYIKSHAVGDIEGIALLKLAKLYQRLGEKDRAADIYQRYLSDCIESEEAEERGRANLYLAEFMMKYGQWKKAEEYAAKCVNCAETQDQGKSIMKEIAHGRNVREALNAAKQLEEQPIEEESTASIHPDAVQETEENK